MSFKDCVDCRHCVVRNKKIKKGVDEKGNMQYEYVPEYHCSYFKIIHSNPQKECDEFVGWMTLFEYLMARQPNEINKMLSIFELRVIGANNKHGFSIVGD